MRKLLVLFLFLVNLVLLYGAYQLVSPLVTSNNAALMVETPGQDAVVTLNGRARGSTPFKIDKLAPGNYTLKLSTDLEIPVASTSATATSSAKHAPIKVNWESQVKLTAGTRTVVNRDLGPSDIFSAGEILTLEKGSGLVVITNPSSAEIQVGDQPRGTGQVSVDESGEKEIKLSAPGYFPRSLKVDIPSGYRLTITANLALNPLTPLSELDKRDQIRLLDLASDNNTLLGNTKDWANGVFYFDGKLASPSAGFALLLDSKGATFSATPKGWELLAKDKKQANIGYLGKKGEGLTDEAKRVFASVSAFLLGTTATATGEQVEILDTPTGFLRVRASASTGATEVAQVDPGEKFPLLDEATGWYKIKLSDGKEGWVSGQYSRKVKS